MRYAVMFMALIAALVVSSVAQANFPIVRARGFIPVRSFARVRFVAPQYQYRQFQQFQQFQQYQQYQPAPLALPQYQQFQQQFAAPMPQYQPCAPPVQQQFGLAPQFAPAPQCVPSGCMPPVQQQFAPMQYQQLQQPMYGSSFNLQQRGLFGRRFQLQIGY